MMFGRAEIADQIDSSLRKATPAQTTAFRQASPTHFAVFDNLLPVEMAQSIRNGFPSIKEMMERRTLREQKYVSAQVDQFSPQAEEALFAFQDERVVQRVAEFSGLPGLEPDPELYAGGLSVMARGSFLNPHVDNSHNNDRSKYRVLNLLYYVSPDWVPEQGGSLEIWQQGLNASATVIPCYFNRLVIMSTGLGSWHSVTRVKSDGVRCCVSNYFFSAVPLGGLPYFRVTHFRGRPEQPVRNLLLIADGWGRQLLRVLRPKGLFRTRHIYHKAKQD